MITDQDINIAAEEYADMITSFGSTNHLYYKESFKEGIKWYRKYAELYDPKTPPPTIVDDIADDDNPKQ